MESPKEKEQIVPELPSMQEVLVGAGKPKETDDEFGEGISTNKAMGEAVANLFKQENIRKVTHLSDRELTLISVARAQNCSGEDAVLDTFLNEFIEMRISKDRLGRQEVIEIIKGMGDVPRDPSSKPMWKFW